MRRERIPHNSFSLCGKDRCVPPKPLSSPPPTTRPFRGSEEISFARTRLLFSWRSYSISLTPSHRETAIRPSRVLLPPVPRPTAPTLCSSRGTPGMAFALRERDNAGAREQPPLESRTKIGEEENSRGRRTDTVQRKIES